MAGEGEHHGLQTDDVGMPRLDGPKVLEAALDHWIVWLDAGV